MNPEIAFQKIENRGGAFDVARRSPAENDVVFSRVFKAELIVECRHAVNLSRGKPEMPGNCNDRGTGERPLRLLNILENCNQILPHSGGMAFQDGGDVPFVLHSGQSRCFR